MNGLIYYAIEQRELMQVVQRGAAGANGTAFERLFLAPNTRYRIWLLDAATLRISDVEFTSGGVGETRDLPPFVFHDPGSPDTDEDGLSDVGEFILGTDAREPDSDRDRLLDGAEVRQGTDPLDERPVRTGIIGTAPINGNGVDIVAGNDLAVVACAERGVSVYNIFNGLNPMVIAQVDTPGSAGRVAISDNIVVVADGPAGLALIDISDPPAARIMRQVGLAGSPISVAVAGPVVFSGLAEGQVVALDRTSGALLGTVGNLPGPVLDVILSGDYLYALTPSKVHVISLLDGQFEWVASVDSPIASERATRLAVGGGVLYVTHNRGYNTFRLERPEKPVLIQVGVTPQFGWRQIAPNGSGVAIAAVDDFAVGGGPEDVSLYNVSDPAKVNEFTATFATPGRATSVAIYNGLAYVADSPAGLQVVNYRAYDAEGQPPRIALTATFSLQPARVEPGKLVSVEAKVADDVQVRNVEFYLDGQKTVTDGNFPFEYRFLTPLRTADKVGFTLRARASDTGGNATWSEEVFVTLDIDATAPRVRRVSPGVASLVAPIASVVATFTEPIRPETLGEGAFRLVRAGADGRLDTADDESVSGGTISYQGSLNAALLTFGEVLPPGLYQASLQPAVTDLAGNAMTALFSWRFRLFSQEDRDKDGFPDELEPSLKLDPTRPDTDGDGTLDGLEDFDADGLPNAAELQFGSDPSKPDTDNNGTLDGAEDKDNDGLTAAQEFSVGTQPLASDSDGDGWPDGAEKDGLSNPLVAESQPAQGVLSAPWVSVILPGPVGGSSAGAVNIALPIVRVQRSPP